MKIHSSCEIEDFVETHLCKLCVILRSRVVNKTCLRTLSESADESQKAPKMAGTCYVSSNLEGGWGVLIPCTAVVLKTIDPRIPAMPEGSMSGFHQPGRRRVHHARSAVRCSKAAGGGGINGRPGGVSGYPRAWYRSVS